jgi:integrase
MKWKLTPTKYPGLYRREGDRRFVVRAYARSAKTGRDKEISRVLPEGTTEADALAALGRLRDAARTEGAPPVVTMASEFPKLLDYVPSWSNKRLLMRDWTAASGTAGTVGWRVGKYIAPMFGDFFIDRLTAQDAKRFLEWLTAQGLAVRTVKVLYNLLCQLIRDARDDHGLPSIDLPPAPNIRRSPRARAPLTWENFEASPEAALTREQLATFLDTARRLSPHTWFPFCVLGFASDARFSELAAVRTDDLNLSGDVGIWLCRRHMIEATGEIKPGVKWNPDGVVHYLDPESTRMLRPFVATRRPGDLVFPSEKRPGYPRTNKGLQWFLDRVSAAGGLPRMTSKIFRRTWSTLSHVNAMADALTQAQAGHTDAKTTMTYVKPSAEHRRGHARQMGAVLHIVDGGKADDEGVTKAADEKVGG